MGLMEVASGKSVYRGYEYYIHNKVLFAEKVDEYQYRGAVEGSADEPYELLIDVIHPRKSHCNCPHADGKRIVCADIFQHRRGTARVCAFFFGFIFISSKGSVLHDKHERKKTRR